jgi:hypothetical protein
VPVSPLAQNGDGVEFVWARKSVGSDRVANEPFDLGDSPLHNQGPHLAFEQILDNP